MNLHSVVSPLCGVVNAPITGSLFISTGATTNSDGSQVPTWQQFSGVAMDVQALTSSELAQVDALNIQGIVRAVYLNGNVEGLDRLAGKGGDVLQFADNGQLAPANWLVTQVLETWDSGGWCKVACTLQVDGGPPLP